MAFAMEVHRNAVRDMGERRARAGRTLNLQSESDQFLRNLMRYVEPILERHRLERRAEAVFAADLPEIQGRNFPNITDAVIRELDENHSTVDLLAAP